MLHQNKKWRFGNVSDKREQRKLAYSAERRKGRMKFNHESKRNNQGRERTTQRSEWNNRRTMVRARRSAGAGKHRVSAVPRTTRSNDVGVRHQRVWPPKNWRRLCGKRRASLQHHQDKKWICDNANIVNRNWILGNSSVWWFGSLSSHQTSKTSKPQNLITLKIMLTLNSATL